MVLSIHGQGAHDKMAFHGMAMVLDGCSIHGQFVVDEADDSEHVAASEQEHNQFEFALMFHSRGLQALGIVQCLMGVERLDF